MIGPLAMLTLHRLTTSTGAWAATNAPRVLGALGALEMGLIALRIPHGARGVQQAVEFLGREFSA